MRLYCFSKTNYLCCVKKNKVTISADIISSTAMNVEDRLILEKKILEVIKTLEEKFHSENFYGRLIKGDYIECVLENPQHALKVALILKSFVKSLDIAENEKNTKIQEFKKYGVKIALAVGELSIFDKEKGIIDGEAIYLSGRSINEKTSSNKENKKTLIFRSSNEKHKNCFESIFSLLDFHFAKLTRTQCEIIYHKLLGKSEKEIAEITNKFQSAVNRASTTAGWWAIDDAVRAFEKNIE